MTPALAMPFVRGKRIVVGIGEFAVSNDPGAVIVTHALGSCVALCLWDPAVKVAGLIHVLLPDSKINRERAAVQPAAFADTGIPLLFQTAYGYGVQKQRCKVRLIGGGNPTDISDGDATIGKRNVQAARAMLWRNGVMLSGEAVGGSEPRTVELAIDDGVATVSTRGAVVGKL